MAAHRNRTSLSTPRSTKLAVGLGVALVFVGFGIAGWQKLAADDRPAPAPATVHNAQQYLPDMRMVVAYLAVIVVVILAGSYLLVRVRRRHSGY